MTQAAITLTPQEENAVARKNAALYAACQSLNGAAAPINIALGGIVGSYLLAADKSLATAPVTGFNLGVALGALPAAMIMRRIGRRYGFMSGAVIGIFGLLFSATAIWMHSFAMFCVGLMLNGMAGAFTQQYRFAAADRGTPDFKAKAISWVLVGGIAAAVIGPQVVIWTKDLLSPIPFAGAFLTGTLLFAASIVVMSFLDPSVPVKPKAGEIQDTGRPLPEIMMQPRFIVAVVCGTASYALMSFVMTAAPLAMLGCGFSQTDSTLGIQWHVLAMFGPSFFTGNLIARFGKVRVITTGLVLLTGAALTGLAGDTVLFFWTSLILLGLGWNFGFIGSTALIAETYHPSEKGEVQGFHDFVLFSLVAFASLMAGLIYTRFGWQTLNHIAFPIIGVCLAALVVLKWLESRQKRA